MKYYNIRVVEADNYTEAVAKVEGNYFEETDELCDSVLTEEELFPDLKSIIKKLPKIRWNILEDQGYFEDEEDNWQHMDDDKRYKYFSSIYGPLKELVDKIEKM